MPQDLKRAALLGLALGLAPSVPLAQVSTTPSKGTLMTLKAGGTFEVKVAPLPEDMKVPGVAVGRMSIDKVFT